MADSTSSDLQQLVVTMRNLSVRYGAIPCEQALSPLEIDHAAQGNEFARGVLSTVAQVVTELGKTPDGRQALLDFFFQPVRQDVEGPRSGGRYD